MFCNIDEQMFVSSPVRVH